MADPMTLLTVGQIGASVLGGVAGMRQGQAQAEQYRAQAQQVRIRGLQEESAIREQTIGNLSALDAMRGASGLANTSGTAAILRRRAERTARRDIQTGRLNAAQAADAARMGAAGARAAGFGSLLAGFGGAIGPARSLLE